MLFNVVPNISFEEKLFHSIRPDTFCKNINTDLQRKSEDYVESISICNVNENLAEHGIYYLACSYTSDVINMLP